MTLQNLKYMLEISNSHSFSKAAKNLFVSQSTLSAAVKELESDLGITIFKRTNRGVSLTYDGEDFIKYAKEKFGCEVSVKMCEKPDTFADIFGASFLNDNEYMENIDDFEDELKYKNSSIEVRVILEGDMDVEYDSNIGFAA